MVALTTSTPAETATPTTPAARLRVKVRTSSRLDAVTAMPWKPDCVASEVLRLKESLGTLSPLPLLCRSIEASVGEPT